MPDSDKDLKVHIATSADINGAKAAKQSLDELNTTAAKGGEQAAESFSAANKSLGKLPKSFAAGTMASRVFGEIMRGNVMAIGHLGSAVKALGMALKTNLVGALVSIGALAATVLVPLIVGFKKASPEAKELAERMKRIKDVQLDKDIAETNKRFTEQNQVLSQTNSLLKTQLDYLEKMRAAQAANEEDAIKNDSSLSETEKVERQREVSNRRLDDSRREEDRARKQTVTDAQDAAARKETESVDLFTQLELLTEEIKKDVQKRRAEAAAEGATQKELNKIIATPEQQDRLQKLQTASDKAAEDLESLRSAAKLADFAFNTTQPNLQKKRAAEDELRDRQYGREMDTATLRDQQAAAAKILSQKAGNAKANTAGNKSQSEALAPILQKIESAASEGNITIEELNDIAKTIADVFEKLKTRDADLAQAVANLGRTVIQMQSQMKTNAVKNNG